MKTLFSLFVALMISQSALSQNASINSAISIVELPQIDFEHLVGAASQLNPDAFVNAQSISKIKPLALPLTQQVYFVIPIYFKS